MSSPAESFDSFDDHFSGLPPSSPPGPVATLASRKMKKPPPITPKRFKRFFTPRNTKSGSTASSMGKSGRQLQEITGAAVNQRTNPNRKTTPRKTVIFADDDEDDLPVLPTTPILNSRKRKTPYLSPGTSPVYHSSPSKRSRYLTPPPFSILEDEKHVSDDEASTLEEEVEEEEEEETDIEVIPEEKAIVVEEKEELAYPTAIRRLRTLGATSRILQRSFGGSSSIGRGFMRDHGATWEDHTGNFYSSSTDFHQLPHGPPPFCTASCHTNNMVAVGDEDGYIHLVDADDNADFTKSHLSWRAHTNAIMDVQFSSDDSYIATGSGDQSAQIIDARTQQTLHVLAKHKSSVKQVRFQPDNENVVATSSRDGDVHIWDLRCKTGNNMNVTWGREAPYVSTIRSLVAAHALGGPVGSPRGSAKARDVMSKSEALNRRAEISVTALSFLPSGREHLLLTASDASTSIKLWDIRGRYSLRGPCQPVSVTRHPESHTKHRHFAINSLTLNGDATRLYALSKDNTVYAYSTSHLILGAAQDLSIPPSPSKQQKYPSTNQEGLGPLYGFRHGNFHAGSFYVKAALRAPSSGLPELLAVGSTDGCPVLFPTDENFLKRESSRRADDEDDLPSPPVSNSRTSSLRSSLRSSSSGVAGRFPSLMNDTIPIYEHGTPLINGHKAEVTSVTWALNGTLVSVGDDNKVRHWKEGSRARDLRLGGETEGRRWHAGWSVVSAAFDNDDE